MKNILSKSILAATILFADAAAVATPTANEAGGGTPATPEVPTYNVGDVVQFKAYAFELPAGTPPTFTPGQELKLIAVGKEPNSFRACLVSDEKVQEEVFAEEIEPKAAAAAAAPKTRGRKKAAAPAAAADGTPAPGAATTTETKEEEKPIVHTEQVTNIIGNDALTAAKTLVTRAEETFFDLGGVLAEIKQKNLHLNFKQKVKVTKDGAEVEEEQVVYAGAKGFANYIEKELGIPYRRGMYYVEAYRKARALGVDEKKLAEIGWAKSLRVLNAATPETFPALVEFAKTHTREQLESHISTSTVNNKSGGGDDNKSKKVRFNFALHDDQGKKAQAAIELAKKKTDSEDVSAAFNLIVTEWMAMQNPAANSVQEQPNQQTAATEATGTTATATA